MANAYAKRASVWAASRDPAFFASFIADPHPLPDDDGPEEAEGSTSLRERYGLQVAPYLDRIPPMEADVVQLYFGLGKPESDIAEIFGVSQAGLAYRLKRALTRLRWLWSVPHFSAGDLLRDLPSYSFHEFDVALLVHMWETTSVSEVGRRLGATQSKTRYCFLRLTSRLLQLANSESAVAPYAAYFHAVRMRPGILWEGPRAGAPKGVRTRFTTEQRQRVTEQVLQHVGTTNLTLNEIARRVGVSPKVVYRIADENGVPRRKRGRRPAGLDLCCREALPNDSEQSGSVRRFFQRRT